MTQPPLELARALAARAHRTGHRLVLALAGIDVWTAATALAVEHDLSRSRQLIVVRLSDSPRIRDANPLSSGTRLIGAECDLLVYDAWSGLDPDALGAAAGTIRAGGLLLLLTPPIADWHRLSDPQAARIAIWPHRGEAVTGRFIRRFRGIVTAHPAVTLIEEGKPLNAPPCGSETPVSAGMDASPDPTRPATADQARAVEAIAQVARGRAHRPLVIVADRGRGKSAALGLAAASLIAQGIGPVRVTAPRRAACEPLFRHAELAAAVPTNVTDGGDPKRSLAFHAPDDLIASCPEARLLLVDEAAGIPAPLLARLLAQYPRVVFATTVHGYEGTGRGFDCRFQSHLDTHTPNWRRLTLSEPIRWRSGDPLESFIARALLLDANPVGAPFAGPPADLIHQRIDRDALSRDEAILTQVFGLLVLAHYQTRPMDLRMLLDGPNLRIHVLRDGDRVVATLLVAEEGSISDTALRKAIYEGRRRPRGHLISQTLSAHAGLIDAPALSCLRVVRIAVHPALKRRGLGSRLISDLRRTAVEEGIDLLGASFGASVELMSFWEDCGLQPVQIGTRRNAASGEHAVVMLAALSPAGRDLTEHARSRLARRFDTLLAGPLRRLDPRLAATLTGSLESALAHTPILDDDRHEIAAFAGGHRPLESALPALAALVRRDLGRALRARTLDLDDAALLVAATRQLCSIAEIAAQTGITGRDGVLKRLRMLMGRLLAAAGGDGESPQPTQRR